jgi:GNAT superfamily N-acetyltransferase
MNENYHIEYSEQPDEAMWAAIGGGLRAYNIQHAGEHGYKQLCFALHGAEGDIAGGVIGETYWDWLFVKLLFVREDLRRGGYGSRLMSMIEQEALRRGVKNSYLDTFSFQAPDFYQKHGYEVFGVLEEFPAGYKRYFLTKRL